MNAQQTSKVIASQIKTKVLGKQVTWFSSIDSTNTFALKVAGGDELHGRLIIADQQTAGRGRHQREWVSADHKDLIFSQILLPPKPEALWPVLTLVFAASICETLKLKFGLNPKIRWPNDILLRDKKVCGILTENANDRLVIGVGCNVNGPLESLPEELQKNATTLKTEVGRSIRRWTFLNNVLLNFEQHYHTFCQRDTESLNELCCRWLGTLGRVVRINRGNEIFTGTAIELVESGALIVRRESGELVELTSGDVLEIKPE